MPLKKWCVGFNLTYNIQKTYESVLYILVLIKESLIGEKQFQFYLNKHKWKKSNYKGYLNCEFAPNKGYKIVYSDTILYYSIKKMCYKVKSLLHRVLQFHFQLKRI